MVCFINFFANGYPVAVLATNKTTIKTAFRFAYISTVKAIFKELRFYLH